MIGAINGRIPLIRARLAEQIQSGTIIIFPVIALFEMRYGSAKSNRLETSERFLSAFLAAGIGIAPFEREDARHAGDIRAHLERQGTPIGPYDILIAAQARSRGATLVTGNIREFARVPQLMVTDWAA